MLFVLVVSLVGVHIGVSLHSLTASTAQGLYGKPAGVPYSVQMTQCHTEHSPLREMLAKDAHKMRHSFVFRSDFEMIQHLPHACANNDVSA